MRKKFPAVVVDDKLREGPDPNEGTFRELLAGRTMQIREITNSDFSSWYSRFKTKNNKLLRRQLADPSDQTEGYIVWLEDADGSDPQQ